MTATPDEATAEAEERFREARRRLEEGDLDGAARIFEELLDLADTGLRAQAALGLAVIRDDLGDVAGACAADRIAIFTGDPEYAPRAAYHLAVCCQRADRPEEARTAWQTVVDLGHPDYLPAAHFALGDLADTAGDFAGAQVHWQRAIDSGDPHYAPSAAHALADRLLGQGDSAAAQDVLEAAVRTEWGADAPELWASLGIVHLERAMAAFQRAVDIDDPEVTPLAVELLARTLPLRGETTAAADIWRHGLSHPDPEVAAAVRERLRRDFGGGDEPGGEQGHPHSRWWEPVVEDAVRHGALPPLTDEVFTALDALYGLVAAAYVRGGRRLSGAVGDALGRAVRVPDGYDWGRDLRDSLRARLGEAPDAAGDVPPEGRPGDAPGPSAARR